MAVPSGQAITAASGRRSHAQWSCPDAVATPVRPGVLASRLPHAGLPSCRADNVMGLRGLCCAKRAVAHLVPPAHPAAQSAPFPARATAPSFSAARSSSAWSWLPPRRSAGARTASASWLCPWCVLRENMGIRFARNVALVPPCIATALARTTLSRLQCDPFVPVCRSQMCGGDGLADVVGRRLGANNKIPYNRSKSLAGSLAMVAGGTVLSAGLLGYLSALGYLTYDVSSALPAIFAVAVGSALIETLPAAIDDNFTVPLAAWALGALLLPIGARAAGVL